MATPEQITPDTKDWTWVLERPCPECGFDGATVPRDGYGAAIRENAADWPPVLAGPAATERPRPEVWSATEYACHVRDVHLLFAERLEQMLTDDGARFANWDQDAAAVEQRYDLQEPGQVATELIAAAERVAAVYDGVPAEPGVAEGCAATAMSSRSRASAATTCTTWCITCWDVGDVRHTEFWSRLEHHLGSGYYRVWADQFVISDLGRRTAQEALDAGHPAQAGLARGVAGPGAAPERAMSRG